MASNFKLDRNGLKKVIQSDEVAREVENLTESIAKNAEGETASGKPIPVKTYKYKPTVNGWSRPGGVVVMAHPAALRVEAKRGSLVKAARETGVDVKGKDDV